ncbi:MAG: phenylalanine--tRNA ligase subunit beta [Opitutaceae bacterium]|jgi:phenylalanyl-tRNA synthetase beta chain|nr:phenylalanine--tRNA ligase subunit beta [Opitutaceae bacterium]
MKISLQWLSRYVDLSGISVEKITDALPMLGLEVEEISQAGLQPLKNVVIGKILSFEKHPKADKLSVCRVDTGDPAGPRQIVCGAKNFAAGDLVPVALPGAVLPGGFEIQVSRLRDIESQGMMCSARELGLGDDHAGLLILTARNLPVGTSINDHFPPPDTVLDLSITANRGDCLGHIGVARELAACFDRPLRLPGLTDATPAAPAPSAEAAPLLASVTVTTGTCPYYTATAIRGIRVADSPDWLARDLLAAGLRPINNIVDITNWVMLETGQPLHAFDAANIGGRRLDIRPARPGETIKLLDQGRLVTLDPADCVIADAEKPLAIGGVMGGEASGVTGATTDIVLEAAYFRPGPIRKTSRRLALVTDSAQRYTRDADPSGVLFAARRATALILEHAGGTVIGPRTVVGELPRTDRTIDLAADYVRARCGIDAGQAPDTTIAATYRRLGFTVEENAPPAAAPANGAAVPQSKIQNPKSKIHWRVTVPSFRSDITRPIDLVEEFVRIHGTTAIPSTPIPAPAPGDIENDDPLATFTRRATARLAGAGFAECVHYTLRDGRDIAAFFGQPAADALALANPLTSELGHIRPSLIPGLLDALALNLAAHNAPRRLFEIGRVFRPVATAGATATATDTAGTGATLRELTAVAFVILAEPVTRAWLKRAPADFYCAKKLALDLAALAGVAPARLQFHLITDGACDGMKNAECKMQNDKPTAHETSSVPAPGGKSVHSSFSIRHSALGGPAPAFWQRNHSAQTTDRARQIELACGLIDAKTARARDIKGHTIIAGELLLPRQLFATAPKRARFQPFSSYPPATRDIALVVDAVTPAGEVADKLKTTAAKIAGKTFPVESVTLFDLYEGGPGKNLPDGKKSLALSLTFRAPDRTLTDDEVNAAFSKLQTDLAKTTPWQIRK